MNNNYKVYYLDHQGSKQFMINDIFEHFQGLAFWSLDESVDFLYALKGTSLEDKNGNEIFDGDEVWMEGDETSKSFVRYHNGCWVYTETIDDKTWVHNKLLGVDAENLVLTGNNLNDKL